MRRQERQAKFEELLKINAENSKAKSPIITEPNGEATTKSANPRAAESNPKQPSRKSKDPGSVEGEPRPRPEYTYHPRKKRMKDIPPKPPTQRDEPIFISFSSSSSTDTEDDDELLDVGLSPIKPPKTRVGSYRKTGVVHPNGDIDMKEEYQESNLPARMQFNRAVWKDRNNEREYRMDMRKEQLDYKKYNRASELDYNFRMMDAQTTKRYDDMERERQFRERMSRLEHFNQYADRRDERETNKYLETQQLQHKYSDRADERHTLAQIEQNKINQHYRDNELDREHQRKMYGLKKYEAISRARDESLDNAQRRNMQWLDFTDERKRTQKQFMDLEKEQRGYRNKAKREAILMDFDLEDLDERDYYQPRISQHKFLNVKDRKSYIGSYLFTGVEDINVDNPNNSVITFTNGEKYRIPKWDDGYTISLQQVHAFVYALHIYKFPNRFMHPVTMNSSDSSMDDDDCCKGLKCLVQ